MAGLVVPAIHAFHADSVLRRGCPRQARAWRPKPRLALLAFQSV